MQTLLSMKPIKSYFEAIKKCGEKNNTVHRLQSSPLVWLSAFNEALVGH